MFHEVKLSHWHHLHQFSKNFTSDFIVVDVKFSDLSRFYRFAQFLSTNVINVIILELQLLNSFAFIN